jgi:FMN phosphatase YigB (HAD superfamily)
MDMGGAMTEERQLGQVIQMARKRAGLTQQGLCQKSGLSYSTLAKIERGAIKTPSVFTIRQVALTLGISLDDLLGNVIDHRPAPSFANYSGAKKTSRNGVRFVYFDMNECLVRFGSRSFAKLADESGASVDAIETIFWQYDAEVCRGTVSIDELNTALAQRLSMLVDWKRYYLEAVEAMPGMDELLRWVGENYHVGIISNTMPGFIESLRAVGRLPNITYDAIVDSSVIHALKPEQAIFDAAVKQAGIEPQEILLVDDNRGNLAAASRLGWKTVWFDAYHPEESIVNISSALQPAD